MLLFIQMSKFSPPLRSPAGECRLKALLVERLLGRKQAIRSDGRTSIDKGEWKSTPHTAPRSLRTHSARPVRQDFGPCVGSSEKGAGAS